VSFVPKDVVMLPESAGQQTDRWVAMNVFARTSLGVDSKTIGLMSNLDASGGGEYRCWDIQRFSNEDGLLADPSRYQRNPADWKELRLTREKVLEKLKAHFIVIDDEKAYRAKFKPKKNLLDRDHFGNFHQQHGQHMMLTRRVNPSEWWMQQKFTPDGLAVRSDTLYGAVQWNFLKNYFAETIRSGAKVIDLGCGNGIYANAMAKHGAIVLGIDPSDEYLSIARANAVAGTSFEKMNIGTAGGLDTVADSSADLVFMSDALLFYFVPFYPSQQADIRVLLADIRRILKPGGSFVSLEPHAAFYLTPWLGAVDRPFTVVTEYMHKSFGVVPPLAMLLQALTQAGFSLTDLREVMPSADFAGTDPRGYAFATEFPLWQMLRLQRH
jgi:SAM-dependent methyltransferase